MALSDDQRHLREFLEILVPFFEHWIEKRIPQSARKRFEDLLNNEINLQIQRAISSINDVDYEEDDLWVRLKEAGLTGPSFSLKMTELSRWFTKKKIRQGVKLLNSILGSFGSVIPAIEPVKEFKDMLEIRLDDDEDNVDDSDSDLGGVIRRARQAMLSAFNT